MIAFGPFFRFSGWHVLPAVPAFPTNIPTGIGSTTFHLFLRLIYFRNCNQGSLIVPFLFSFNKTSKINWASSFLEKGVTAMNTDTGKDQEYFLIYVSWVFFCFFFSWFPLTLLNVGSPSPPCWFSVLSLIAM